MIFIRSVEKIRESYSEEFPYSVPLISNFSSMDFTSSVTFLVGDNGSGKSTLLEAIAIAAGTVAVGSSPLETDPSLDRVREFATSLRLVKNCPATRGFFFRSEDFFGFIKKIKKEIQEFKDLEMEFGEKFTGYGRQLSMGSARNQYSALIDRYGEDPDALSHGEAFLHLFQSRIVPKGFYILDEPETPLSPQLQLALLSLIKTMVSQSCQFLIATHSPILMAFPDARILSLGEGKINEICYDKVEQVSLTRSFLADPENYLRRL